MVFMSACVMAGACSSTEAATLVVPTTTTRPTTTAAPETTTTFRQPPPWTGRARIVDTQDHTVFARTANLSLLHPARNVERIGFHESSHDGAQEMTIVDSTIAWIVMDTRDRGNGSRTAADIVVDPADPIVAPITGTVIRSGPYTLYCEHADNFVVIEPDDQPGWEVKMFHILNLTISTGDKVVAGETQVAQGARLLPFDSQVDSYTAEPAWGHVHIEVVDPSIPDRKSGGGC
jgi:hypothetical protein